MAVEVQGEIETNAALLGRVAGGNSRARQEILNRSLPPFERWIRGRVPAWAWNALSIGELVQEVIEQVLDSIEREGVEDPDAFLSDLREMLLGRFHDEVRRIESRVLLSTTPKWLPDSSVSMTEVIVGRQNLSGFEAALARLPYPDQSLVVGRIELGWSYRQLAGFLSIPSQDLARTAAAQSILGLAKAMGRGGSKVNAEQLLTLSTAVADQDEISWATYLDETKSDSLPLLRALRTIEKIGGISDRVSGQASAERPVADSQGSVYAGTTFVAPSISSGVSRLVGNSIDGATLDAGSFNPQELRDQERAGTQYQEGDRWQHLEIVELIGRGASASVYLAIDTVLGREVALKLIEVPPTASHRVVANLLNEAQLLARIRHPNVSTVYGAARHQGFVGLWMELIRGQTLKDLVTRTGPLSWAETVVVVADVARAMRSLHQQGILHRDIKANNVLREAGGRIVLARKSHQATKKGCPHVI